jgi:hypothetical protein
MSTTSTILWSHLDFLIYIYMASEQRPHVSNGHYFWVSRVVVEHRFYCISTAVSIPSVFCHFFIHSFSSLCEKWNFVSHVSTLKESRSINERKRRNLSSQHRRQKEMWKKKFIKNQKQIFFLSFFLSFFPSPFNLSW